MTSQSENNGCFGALSAAACEPKADEKARFEILFQTLRDYQQGLLESTSKTSGFLLLSIGWLATSTTARDILASDGLLRTVAAAAVLLAVTLYTAAALHVYQVARRVHTRLVELVYVPVVDLEARRLSGLTLMVFIFGNTTIALLLAVLIWRLG